MKVLLTALALGAAAIGTAGAHEITTLTAPAATDAERLVALLAPDEMIVKVTTGVMDKGVQDETQFSPEKRKLYADNPGLKQAVTDRMRGEVTRLLRAELPGLRKQLGALLDAEMTPTEVSDTLTFFSSPTGGKMLSTMYAAIAETGVADQENAKQTAIAAMMASLTEADYPALMAFSASAGARKLQAVTPKIGEASKAWAEALIARQGPALAAVVETTTAEFLAKKK